MRTPSAGLITRIGFISYLIISPEGLFLDALSAIWPEMGDNYACAWASRLASTAYAR